MTTTIKKKPAAKKTTVKVSKKTVADKKTPEMNLTDFVVKVLDDGKALNILSINLKGKTSLTDYLIIASGTSSRHVMALASTLGEKLKDKGYKPKIDGKQGSGDWVVLDIGDIIVHIFVPSVRSFYEIETLWGEKTPVA